MLESYTIKDLLIGKLVTVTNQGWIHGPNMIYEGPYIFYQTKVGKYIEVFTETEYSYCRPSIATTRKDYKVSQNVEQNEFGKTYIEPTDSILNYLTEEELIMLKKSPNASLNKKRIVEIYKDTIVKNAECDKQVEELEKQYVHKNNL